MFLLCVGLHKEAQLRCANLKTKLTKICKVQKIAYSKITSFTELHKFIFFIINLHDFILYNSLIYKNHIFHILADVKIMKGKQQFYVIYKLGITFLCTDNIFLKLNTSK